MEPLINARAVSKQPFPFSVESDGIRRRLMDKRQPSDHPTASWPSSLEKLFMAKIIEAQEAERRRIARDIHDETEQLLGSAIFRLDACLVNRRGLGDSLKEEISSVRDVLIETVHGLQNLSQSLRPSVLDDLGLEACLAWFFRTTGLKDRLRLHSNITGLNGRLPPTVEIALFRIIQEACNNVLKHAQAKNLRVVVHVYKDRATAMVSDDGVGFHVRSFWSQRYYEEGPIAMGLSGMRERATLAGGKLFVHSYPRQGTRVLVTIPLPPKDKEAL